MHNRGPLRMTKRHPWKMTFENRRNLWYRACIDVQTRRRRFLLRRSRSFEQGYTPFSPVRWFAHDTFVPSNAALKSPGRVLSGGPWFILRWRFFKGHFEIVFARLRRSGRGSRILRRSRNELSRVDI